MYIIILCYSIKINTKDCLSAYIREMPYRSLNLSVLNSLHMHIKMILTINAQVDMTLKFKGLTSDFLCFCRM